MKTDSPWARGPLTAHGAQWQREVKRVSSESGEST